MSKFHSFASILRKGVIAAGIAAMAASVHIRDAAAESILLAHPMPTDHIYHRLSEAFIETLKKKSDGKWTVDYHPGGDLGSYEALFEQVLKNVIPMTFSSPDSTVDPRIDVQNLGYIAANWDEARRNFGPGGFVERYFSEIFAEKGLTSFGIIPAGFGGIAIRKGSGKVPVNFPEDAAGIRLRIPALPIANIRYSALGFSPVPIPFTEAYTALQLGTVDARSYAPIPEVWQQRDVLETYIRTNDYFEYTFWLVSTDWWNGLAEQDRKTIKAAADEALANLWDLALEIEADYTARVKATGIKVVELTPEQTAKAKQVVQEKEWPYIQQYIGSDFAEKLKKIDAQ